MLKIETPLHRTDLSSHTGLSNNQIFKMTQALTEKGIIQREEKSPKRYMIPPRVKEDIIAYGIYGAYRIIKASTTL